MVPARDNAQQWQLWANGGISHVVWDSGSGDHLIYGLATNLFQFIGGTHIFSASGTAPSLTSCGTSPSIVGTDMAGEVTMGTGSPTGCVITFHAAYASAPICTVTWQATPLASQSYVTSTSAISSNKVNYICIGQSGG